MLPDRVSNPGPPIYESCALPIALRGPAIQKASLHTTILLLNCSHRRAIQVHDINVLIHISRYIVLLIHESMQIKGCGDLDMNSVNDRTILQIKSDVD